MKEDNEHDSTCGGGDVGLPDCRHCLRPERKHRASDNLCPPPTGDLADVAYWHKSPGTFYEPVPVDPDAITTPIEVT